MRVPPKLASVLRSGTRAALRHAPALLINAAEVEHERRARASTADPIWTAVESFTKTSPLRVRALTEAVQYVVRSGVEGAFVECGVWRGGSSMAMALALQAEGAERDLYLFDTFAGMTPPSEIDRRLDGRSAADLLADPATSDGVLCVADIADVTKNMHSTGYPAERIHLVAGDVLHTLPDQAPRQIALLRLDTDFYDSTRHELETMVPRVTAGGILIVDDYDYWQGSRAAVDEYFADHPLFFHPLDGGARLAIVR